MIDASVKKSLRALSELPGFSVLIATSTSTEGDPRTFNLPLHTSPNSPPPAEETTRGLHANSIDLGRDHGLEDIYIY
jgi:hypothetical protein